MKNFNYFILILLLVSCDETSSTNESTVIESPSIIKEDSIVTEPIIEEVSEIGNINIDVNSLLLKIDSNYSSPFVLDSTYIEDFEIWGESKLSNEEVQYLSFNRISNKPTSWTAQIIFSFIEIDSMRIMGTYNDYLDNHIDIGMIQDCDAGVYSKINISESDFILLWGIKYASYPACPSSYGTVVYGTYFSNNTAINTATLGENSGGGDAPYWSTILVTSEINTTSIVSRMITESGGDEDEETGEEIIDKTDESYNIKITKSGFEVVGGKED